MRTWATEVRELCNSQHSEFPLWKEVAEGMRRLQQGWIFMYGAALLAAEDRQGMRLVYPGGAGI